MQAATTNLRPRKRVHSAKDELIKSIYGYIAHKNVLSAVSPFYKQPLQAQSLAKCNEAFSHVFKDRAAYSYKRVCQIVVLFRDHLRNILPAHNNNSYHSCSLKVESIISTATNAVNSVD